jgi:hypothetical protein
MPTEQLSPEEYRRRAREARDAQRAERGVLAAIERRRQIESIRGGHDPRMDSLVSGALSGAALNYGDELFGGMRDFEGDYGANPGAYQVGGVLGMLASPLAMIVSRLPLIKRERLFNEARDFVAREGVAQRNLPRPDRLGGAGGYMPFADRRFDQPLPDVPAQLDINVVRNRGDDVAANRLAMQRADGLDQAEELLAHRRRALDDYSGLDAFAHGAVIGSGGVEPGDTSIEERATGGVLGALGALALTRGSSEIGDLSGYLTKGARHSAQEVVDLPGPRNAPASVDDFLARARMFEEQAFRERTNDTFFGRAAGPSETMRQDPNVAPIDDANSLIRGALARAQQTNLGAERARERSERIDVSRALEHYGGMTAANPPAAGDPPLLPAHVRDNLPAAVRVDPPMRPDALRTVMGDERYFPDRATGRGGVDPALRSERQADDLKRNRVSTRQYPGMNQAERRELAQLVADDAFTQARALAQLPKAEQVRVARKLLNQLDDPHFKRLMQTLQLRKGQSTPVLERLMELETGLKRIAGGGGDYASITRTFDRGGGRGADPVVAEAASMLSQYPMSRRMAEALLDETTLTTQRPAYWVNPAERGDQSMLQVRRESVRPAWPYAAPAGIWSQRGGDLLALGLDHAQHALLDDVWAENGAR